MDRRRKNSPWKNLFKKRQNYSDEESESEYEQQYQHHQQIRAEGAAMSLGHNEQIQHEIEKRLAIIETQMDEIRQILANNQRVLPAPRTRPSQTVSLFRATVRRSRARQADHNSAITKSFPKGQTKNEFNHWTCLSRDVASVWRRPTTKPRSGTIWLRVQASSQ